MLAGLQLFNFDLNALAMNIIEVKELHISFKQLNLKLLKANKIKATWDNLLYYYVEKEKMISEDDFHRGREQVQELTDEYVNRVDEVGERKEEEILEV